MTYPLMCYYYCLLNKRLLFLKEISQVLMCVRNACLNCAGWVCSFWKLFYYYIPYKFVCIICSFDFFSKFWQWLRWLFFFQGLKDVRKYKISSCTSMEYAHASRAECCKSIILFEVIPSTNIRFGEIHLIFYLML